MHQKQRQQQRHLARRVAKQFGSKYHHRMFNQYPVEVLMKMLSS